MTDELKKENEQLKAQLAALQAESKKDEHEQEIAKLKDDNEQAIEEIQAEHNKALKEAKEEAYKIASEETQKMVSLKDDCEACGIEYKIGDDMKSAKLEALKDYDADINDETDRAVIDYAFKAMIKAKKEEEKNNQYTHVGGEFGTNDEQKDAESIRMAAYKKAFEGK
jgi:hypothetical protein